MCRPWFKNVAAIQLRENAWCGVSISFQLFNPIPIPKLKSVAWNGLDPWTLRFELKSRNDKQKRKRRGRAREEAVHEWGHDRFDRSHFQFLHLCLILLKAPSMLCLFPAFVLSLTPRLDQLTSSLSPISRNLALRLSIKALCIGVWSRSDPVLYVIT